MYIPEIYAKASLTEEQINAKERIGCDGIEIQLLGEMIIDRNKGIFKSAEDAYDLSLLSQHEIRVVHSPLVRGTGDITLERMADDVDGFLMEQIFLIAEEASKYHGRYTSIVIHTEEFYDRLIDMGDSWFRIVEKVGFMLQKYPHTELLIENVSPLRDIGKGKELHLSNNFAFDNVVMAEVLNKELGTNRIGVCLDTCHQMLAKKYITGIYDMVADVPAPDLSLDKYFEKYSELLRLIHLCNITGSGYGPGKHGIPFHMGTYSELKKIMDTYYSHNTKCPITLEVEETDFTICSGYKNTKDTLQRYFNESDRMMTGAYSISNMS